MLANNIGQFLWVLFRIPSLLCYYYRYFHRLYCVGEERSTECIKCYCKFHLRCIGLHPSMNITQFVCCRCKPAAAASQSVLRPIVDGLVETAADHVVCNDEDVLEDFISSSIATDKPDVENDDCIIVIDWAAWCLPWAGFVGAAIQGVTEWRNLTLWRPLLP